MRVLEPGETMSLDMRLEVIAEIAAAFRLKLRNCAYIAPLLLRRGRTRRRG